jgi:hypothetical protein
VNIYCVVNSTTFNIEEVSTSVETAVQVRDFCNSSGKDRYDVYGPFVADSAYDKVVSQLPKRNTYAEHLKQFGMEVVGDRDAQRDAQLRAMGHDPTVYKAKVAARTNQHVIQPSNPKLTPEQEFEKNQLTRDYSQMSAAHLVTTPPIAEEDLGIPADYIEFNSVDFEQDGESVEMTLTDFLRAVDPSELRAALHELSEDDGEGEVIFAATTQMKMKH